MAIPEPQSFARSWLDAWNCRDIDAVLSHFAEDAVFSSPLAAQIVAGSDGVVRGKQALRSYWTAALERNAGLHFELIDVYAGVDALVINYRNTDGGSVNEVLIFGPDGLVSRGFACRLDR